jgi:hypothetical protein
MTPDKHDARVEHKSIRRKLYEAGNCNGFLHYEEAAKIVEEHPADAAHPSAPVGDEVESIQRAFQREWNDYVMDTGGYPDAFLVERGRLSADFIKSCFGEKLAKAAISAMQAAAVHPALQAASDILERFAKSKEAERPKIEEWEACYAMLFKQMNDVYQNYHATAVRECDGWFIPLSCMTKLAQETFTQMMAVIAKGGQVDVIARCDGRDYRWECDGLKYAKPLPTAPGQTSEGYNARFEDAINSQGGGVIQTSEGGE